MIDLFANVQVFWRPSLVEPMVTAVDCTAGGYFDSHATIDRL
jgi:hypothetical protein